MAIKLQLRSEKQEASPGRKPNTELVTMMQDRISYLQQENAIQRYLICGMILGWIIISIVKYLMKG